MAQRAQSEIKITTKHCLDFEIYLKNAKRDFDERWKRDFKPNASLQDFTLKKTLGTGSFGRVLMVHKTGNESKVYALKVLEKGYIIKTKQVAHTINEIRILDAMRFEFIIFLEYFFKDNVYLFLVMPFISGGEMFTHLRIQQKFDETLSKFYAAQVILALEYMHYLGVVYRDLKPENILINIDGYLKITDLGFAKKIDDQRTYTLCGTPEYLAPEIILSQGYNESVDWWAVGILIFEMNAGFPPFTAKEPMKIYEKIVAGKYQNPAFFSQPLRDLTSNLIKVERSKRYGILKNGTKDIKFHEWFKGLDWDAVLTKKVKPKFKPTVKGGMDTSNFDRYDEQKLRSNPVELFPTEFASFVVR